MTVHSKARLTPKRFVSRKHRPSVGVRRSPRTNPSSLAAAQQPDDDSGPETEINVDFVDSRPQPTDSPDKADDDAGDEVADGEVADADAGVDGDDGDEVADAGDGDEVVDVVEDDSTTCSLSTSLSAYETQPTMTQWHNSVSSEADSVDVVSPHDTAAAAADDDDDDDTHQRHHQHQQDMSLALADDDDSHTDQHHRQQQRQQDTSLTDEGALVSSSSGVTASGVRRGAMWRDSLFPSDFERQPAVSISSSFDAQPAVSSSSSSVTRH